MLVAISLRVLNTREFLLITQVIRWLRLFEVMPLNSEMRIMVGRRRIIETASNNVSNEAQNVHVFEVDTSGKMELIASFSHNRGNVLCVDDSF